MLILRVGLCVLLTVPGTCASVATGGSSQVSTTAGSPAPVAAPPPGFPAATTTGVRPGTKLTEVRGDRTFAKDGEVVEGRIFLGLVKVTGKGVTFRNCVFRGRPIQKTSALLTTEKGRGTVVTDSTFAPAYPSASLDAVWAARTKLVRVDISGTVDGVKAGSDTLIQDSYLHDFAWFSSDPDQGGGETHNDGVQSWTGVRNVVLLHNTIDMSATKRANAAWQSSSSEARAERNYFDGGLCTLNFDHKPLGAPIREISLIGNRFGSTSYYDCPILLSTRSYLAVNKGNVWHKSGKAIPRPERHD